MLLCARIIGGVGSAFTFPAASLQLSEIALIKMRGTLDLKLPEHCWCLLKLKHQIFQYYCKTKL